MTLSVLLVDDYAPFRAAARRSLEGADFHVVGEAADGTDALAQADLLHPDVVLLDVGLPDLDGLLVCGELMRRLPLAQVVICSARDSSEVMPGIPASGAVGFLDKAEVTPAGLRRLLGSGAAQPSARR